MKYDLLPLSIFCMMILTVLLYRLGVIEKEIAEIVIITGIAIVIASGIKKIKEEREIAYGSSSSKTSSNLRAKP